MKLLSKIIPVAFSMFFLSSSLGDECKEGQKAYITFTFTANNLSDKPANLFFFTDSGCGGSGLSSCAKHCSPMFRQPLFPNQRNFNFSLKCEVACNSGSWNGITVNAKDTPDFSIEVFSNTTINVCSDGNLCF